MSYASEKRWENLWYFPTDLMKLYRKVPTNPAKVKAVQDRKVRELMKIAYGIPFYRERFEATGTTPEDYTCAEDSVQVSGADQGGTAGLVQSGAGRVSRRSTRTGISRPPAVPPACPCALPFRPRRTPGTRPTLCAPSCWPASSRGSTSVSTGPTACTRPLAAKSWTQQLIDTRWKDMSDAIKQRVPSRILLQEINDYKPDYLYIHKNIMVRVCLYAKRNRLYLHKPKWYSPISEMLRSQQRSAAEGDAGAGADQSLRPVRDFYGGSAAAG